MPYIDQEARTELAFDRDPEVPGELSFVLYSACMDYINSTEPSFTLYNEVIGVLENVKSEIQRRYLHPYEDEKLKENGDVV